MAAADTQFAGYRTSVASPLDAFNWAGARACLQRALFLSPSNAAVRGRLELAEAHEHLVAGTAERAALHGKLTVAASLLPTWPDPHLALARYYVYRQQNLGLAVAEWHTAERLGFRTGPREWEQEADGYLSRVESTFAELRARKALSDHRRLYALLGRDAARARQRYEPITGFGRVTQSLARLQRLENAAGSLNVQRTRASASKKRRSSRSW